MTKIVAESQSEQLIVNILLVKEGKALLHGSNSQVALEINKL